MQKEINTDSIIPGSPGQDDPLLELKNVKVHFTVKRNLLGAASAVIKAVDGVSLSLCKGETLGLVGESGCGKSTLARAVMQLAPLTGGQVLYEGRDIAAMSGADAGALCRTLQLVFQDPYASLNPRMTVESALSEPLTVHKLEEGSGVSRRVSELLEMVGLPLKTLRKYPHEFSGGQRQRIVIARALAMKPRILIADEPVSALDVSIQAQILNLLATLRKQLGLSLIFIAHDLSVVRHVSDHVAVMYLGRVVESGPSQDLMERPAHPYTRALVSSVPRPDPVLAREAPVFRVQGEIPSPINPPPGCPFHPRCPYAIEACRTEVPQLAEFASSRKAACLRTEILLKE